MASATSGADAAASLSRLRPRQHWRLLPLRAPGKGPMDVRDAQAKARDSRRPQGRRRRLRSAMVQGIRFVPTLILIPRVQVCCAGQGRNACVDMLILGAMWSLLDRLRPPPLGWNWKDAGCWRRRRVQEGGR